MLDCEAKSFCWLLPIFNSLFPLVADNLSSQIELPRSGVFMSVFSCTFISRSYDVNLIYAQRTQQNV